MLFQICPNSPLGVQLPQKPRDNRQQGTLETPTDEEGADAEDRGSRQGRQEPDPRVSGQIPGQLPAESQGAPLKEKPCEIHL